MINTHAYMYTTRTTCIHIYAYTIAYSCTDQIHTHDTFIYHTHIAKHTYIHNTHIHALMPSRVGMRMHHSKYKLSIHPVMKFPRCCEHEGSKGAKTDKWPRGGHLQHRHTQWTRGEQKERNESWGLEERPVAVLVDILTHILGACHKSRLLVEHTNGPIQ